MEAVLLLPQVCPVPSRPIPMHGTRAGGQQERVPALPPQGRILHQKLFLSVRDRDGLGELRVLCSERSVVPGRRDAHGLCFCVSLHHRKAGSRAEED